MSQYYVDPNTVEIRCKAYNSKTLRLILEDQGQIVPILVRKDIDGTFYVDDQRQADRVLCCRELLWPTILIEDKWTEDDLW